MIKVTVNSVEYSVEFRHHTRLGKHPRLAKYLPIKAITTCVIMWEDHIVIENAVCTDEDNFSREQGRMLSLVKALQHSPLNKIQGVFLSAFLLAIVPMAGPKKMPHRTTKLSAEQKAACKAQGHHVRLFREQIRTSIQNG